jgi:hypothetical protein
MHVVLVIAVGTRTQDRRETGAGALAQAESKILGDLRVGQPEESAVGKLNRADVERIGLAMLGELGAGDPVAATARQEPRPRAPIARWPRQTCSGRSRGASTRLAFCPAATPLRAALRRLPRIRRGRPPRATTARPPIRSSAAADRPTAAAAPRARRLPAVAPPAAARRGPGPAAAAAMGSPARPPNRTRPKRREPQGG